MKKRCQSVLGGLFRICTQGLGILLLLLIGLWIFGGLIFAWGFRI